MTGREKHEHVVLFLYIRGKKTSQGALMAEPERGAGAKGWGGRASSACPARCVVQGGSHRSSPRPAAVSTDRARRVMPGRDTRDVLPGAPMVPDPPASILHLPRHPALPALLNLPFSPHFEVSANFVPLGRAGAWGAQPDLRNLLPRLSSHSLRHWLCQQRAGRAGTDGHRGQALPGSNPEHPAAGRKAPEGQGIFVLGTRGHE